LSIGSAALILVLSVFNGFEDLIASMVNAFNPDLKITPTQGKYFSEEEVYQKLSSVPGIFAISKTIEETAFFEYDKTPSPGTIKGVDPAFAIVNDIDSALIEGDFLFSAAEPQAVLGAGLTRILGVDVLNLFKTLSVYTARRQKSVSVSKPFKERTVRPTGVFAIQQDIDNQYVLVPLDFAQELLDRKGMISSLELRLEKNALVDDTQDAVAGILGSDFLVRNRYEQDEEFLKIMNIEKWMAYSIACLMILLISFNLVGCLWMVVLDKQKDISILKAMGTTSTFVRNVFIKLGLLYTGTGLVIGLLLAMIFYFLQIQFGIITIPEGFVVDSYPIRMKARDVLIVALTVIGIGWLASQPPSRRASVIEASIRND